jgi:hypothetical protein
MLKALGEKSGEKSDFLKKSDFFDNWKERGVK